MEIQASHFCFFFNSQDLVGFFNAMPASLAGKKLKHYKILN